jgi:hypothetical protein
VARFRFKIVDSQGKRRSGVLRAESLQVAESALRSKLCQIEQLVPLPDEGQAVEVGRLETSFSQVDRIRRVLAGFMTLILALSLHSWVTQTKKTAAPTPQKSTAAVSFKVTGLLQFKGASTEPSEWTVYVVFPDLPYEVGGRLEDDAGGRISEAVDLEGVERPKQVAVDVEYEGRRWRLPAELAMPASGDVDLGTLEVTVPSTVERPQPGAVVQQTPIPSNGEPRIRGRRLTKEKYKGAIEAKSRGKARKR